MFNAAECCEVSVGIVRVKQIESFPYKTGSHKKLPPPRRRGCGSEGIPNRLKGSDKNDMEAKNRQERNEV